MSIDNLGENLRTINPDGTWRHGHCSCCAFEAATVLVTGRNPQRATVGVQALVSPTGVEWQYPHATNRAALVWTRLNIIAANSVCVAEDEADHCYVFVTNAAGNVYLVDTQLHVFKQLQTAADGIAQTHSRGVLDYLNPAFDPTEATAVLRLMHWGYLAAVWQNVLGW